MHKVFDTYRELTQWAWDLGLLRTSQRRDFLMLLYSAGLGVPANDAEAVVMHDDFVALEELGEMVGVWRREPEWTYTTIAGDQLLVEVQP